MKYLFVVSCLLLFIFACQSDLSDDAENISENTHEYGKAVYGESEYGEMK